VLTTTRITEHAAEALLAYTSNKYVILLLITCSCWLSLLPRAHSLDLDPGAGADAVIAKVGIDPVTSASS